MKEREKIRIEGLKVHCRVASKMIKDFKLTPHSNHHIRSAIREATKKVDNLKTLNRRKAHYISKEAFKVIKGKKPDKLISEHTIPVSYIVDVVKQMSDPTTANIRDLVTELTIITIITESENSDIHKDFVKKMPEGWSRGDNVFDRYKGTNIEVMELDSGLIEELKSIN